MLYGFESICHNSSHSVMSLSLEYSSRKVDFDLRLICLLRQRCDFLSLSLSLSFSLKKRKCQRNYNHRSRQLKVNGLFSRLNWFVDSAPVSFWRNKRRGRLDIVSCRHCGVHSSGAWIVDKLSDIHRHHCPMYTRPRLIVPLNQNQ